MAATHQVSSELAGEAVILDLKSGKYYGLNSVGARIWELIQQPRRVAAIHERLLAEFEVAPDRCWSDLIALLQRLVGIGLVEVAHEPAT
jgi:hypothetical protein